MEDSTIVEMKKNHRPNITRYLVVNGLSLDLVHDKTLQHQLMLEVTHLVEK